MKTLCVLHFCFPLFFTLLCFSSNISSAIDTLTPTQSINDSQTLVSSGEIFELGFFSPNNSKNRYVGIWYKKISIQTVVWVANRDIPLTDSSGAVLKISQEGKLVLLDKETRIIWSSNQSNAGNPVVKLLDSGNLVLKEENDNDPQNYLWQSFDFPTDTLLPGMKLGLNLKTGLNRFLTSWKSEEDPSSGDNFFRIDPHGSPQAFLFNRADKKYRSGPWNGVRFSGVPEMLLNHSVNFIFTFNSDEITYSFTQSNEIPFSRLMVNHNGVLQRFTWLESSHIWNLFWYAPKDQCDSYRECGGYGICDPNLSPVCTCVQGFESKNPQNWDLRDGSDGCVRKTKFECQHGDGFLTLQNMKLPDTSFAFLNKTMSLKECEDECRRNCSCSAYANSDITEGGSGCVIWVGDLIDLRDYSEGGQDLYVRVASSELGKVGSTGSKSNSHKKTMIVGLTVGLSILLLGSSVYFIWNKKKKTIKSICKRKTEEEKGNKEKSRDLLLYDGIILGSQRDKGDENTKDDLELPLFDFSTIAIATNNFSDTNKLGQGGFGCVYKGKLAEGHDIAVKRLSKNSGQGIEEFKNEVNLIAKLQHRNLVRLIGCCIKGEERILVYEYMQNKSLDSVIFDKEKSSLLNWPIRFHIIGGIARGLLYLHQDSRFRIIHRDLKASNVLLDDEMNPKISDFGMARIFGKDQINANTNRIVGTYGYMSPEYAMDGLFSVKSDVFSFGVLVLEIVSGMKNRGFYYSNHQLNLLGHAWGLWREGKGLEFFDAFISDSCSASEVLRCIQVGLLCVQEHAEDRPTMASVVLMLGSETASLPQPKNPGFCLGRSTIETDSSSSQQESFTVNHVTVTMPQGR